MEDVFRYVDSHREEIVRELETLCRQPSISAQGVGIGEMAEHVARHMREAGFEAEIHKTPGNPIVRGTLRGRSERTLLFYNHYDVQPPEPLDAWTSPPFEPTVREGCLFARGATDNKGNIVSRLQAFKALRATRGELSLTVKYIVEGEEEVGSPSLEGFVASHKGLLAAHGVIWEDAQREDAPVITLGNKGLCYLELTCRTANVDFHSSHAPVYHNAAWRLLWALASLKGPDERVRIEGFDDPVRPLTPREEELLAKLPPANREARARAFGIRGFLLDASGQEAAVRFKREPTCNVAGFESGYTGEGVKTIVPGRARAKLDFRLVADQDPDQVHRQVRAHLERGGFGDVESRMLFRSLPARFPPEAAVVRAAQEAARLVYRQEAAVDPLGSGGTPTWVVARHLGIPLASTGVGHIGARTHGADERIRLDHLFEGVKYMAAIVERFAAQALP
ncbi:MAG: M20/M25/M40 family metallo-hydrolase [Nitrospinota bacterium]